MSQKMLYYAIHTLAAAGGSQDQSSRIASATSGLYSII